ncbi:hypothetical protein NLI96_g7931 [Meripilus lineatus]|uniref:Uncharacterized protein n=1 Tax=Meripilus lineatus TaxID=2056292 RepID=A0AAD5UZV2_9APHY|nr:hypothetical protein NLI96_g7931 [Physisporinus lineatus]
MWPTLQPSRSDSISPPSPPSDPVTPATPTRGRLPARYPSSLARGEPGRVPLHKRGKSKTYERLEDLLREAGYKETRVFTPEMERAEARAEERKRRIESMRIGVGAVVDFFAGWIPGAHNLKADTPTTPSLSTPSEQSDMRQQSSLPPSPLAHKRRAASRSTITTTSSGSTKYSSSTSPTIRHQHIVHDHHQLHHEPHHLRNHHRHHHHHHHHHHSQQQPQPQRQDPDAILHPSLQRLRTRASASESLRTYAQVSAARGYLRHMASTPTLPKSRQLARDQATVRPPARRTITLNGEDHVLSSTRDVNIPQTSRWLQSVTQAVLGTSSTGSGIAKSGERLLDETTPSILSGGSSRPSSSLSGRTARSTGTRTRCSQGQAGGATTTAEGVNPSKMLTAYMQRSKTTAPSKVTTVKVFCRSAPASRSSSRTGGDRVPVPPVPPVHTLTSLNWEQNAKGKTRDYFNYKDPIDQPQQQRAGNHKKSRGGKKVKRPSDGVPMLANIRIEGDVWAQGVQWFEGRRIPTIGTTFAVTDVDKHGYSEDDFDDDEEDEGEVDLARLLK